MHHPESMPQSLHDHARTLSGVNDLNKQNSPVRQYYDTRNMGEFIASETNQLNELSNLLKHIIFFSQVVIQET